MKRRQSSTFKGPPKLQLAESQKQDLADLFELFDTDGGGTLDEDEIKIALLTLGFFNTTEEEVEEYVRHLDVEEKGGLNLEQFVMLVTEKVSNRNLRKELKSAFDWMTKGERYLKLTDIKDIARDKDIEVTELRLHQCSELHPAALPVCCTNLAVVVVTRNGCYRMKTPIKIWSECGSTSTSERMATCLRSGFWSS